MADKLPTNLSQLRTLPQTGSSLMPFLRGAGSGLSMGLSEPIGASLASLFAAKGNPLEAYRIYPEMRGIVEEQRAGLEQQSPGAYAAGEFGVPLATLAPAALSLAKMAPKATQYLTRTPPTIRQIGSELPIDAEIAKKAETLVPKSITGKPAGTTLSDTDVIAQEMEKRLRIIRAEQLMDQTKKTTKPLSFSQAIRAVDDEIITSSEKKLLQSAEQIMKEAEARGNPIPFAEAINSARQTMASTSEAMYPGLARKADLDDLYSKVMAEEMMYSTRMPGRGPGKTMNPKASANVDELLRLRGQLDASLETKGVMSDFDYYQQMNDVVNRFMK